MSAAKYPTRFLIPAFLILIILLGACARTEPPAPQDSATPFPPATNTSPAPTATLEPSPEPTQTTAPSPTPADVTEFPDPANYTWIEIASGLNKPIGLVSAGDGSGRLFIILQPGLIVIHDGSSTLETPFLDLRDRVGIAGSEQGLLGLAFHPDYSENGIFYVSYTDPDWNNVISRFQVSSNPDQAEGGSETILLTIPQPYTNHNGGQILFGPEGYLWIAIGDGGSAGDPQGNAQNTGNLLGTLLRIDVNQEPYTIPEGNPFGNEIWAYGLRNPWRFTFDPVYQDLYIADVGQAKWEEVNFLPAGSPAGANFGWDYREGKHSFEGTPPESLPLIDPIAEYDHGQGCSISGGAVYRGSLLEWQGVYLYGDFCFGTVWGLINTPEGEWLNQSLFQFDSRIAAIDQDEYGEVYLVDIYGNVLKLTQQ